MLVFKEKHIEYNWTNDSSLAFAKGTDKGKVYNGPIMIYFKKIFAGEKMTPEVAKFNSLVPYEGLSQTDHLEYNELKPKYASAFIFPEETPTDPTEKK